MLNKPQLISEFLALLVLPCRIVAKISAQEMYNLTKNIEGKIFFLIILKLVFKFLKECT